jgi:hypothetical protein
MIDIFTCLTGNSAPYAKHLKENLLETFSFVRFHAIADDTFKGEADGWKIHEVVPRRFPNGSANHGHMLNRIINYIPKDSEIVVVADVDVAVLDIMWPHVLHEIHYKDNHDIAITKKFSGAASVYFTSFRADAFREANPDFRPGTKENGYQTKTVMMDTGYKLDSYFKNPYWYRFNMTDTFRYLYSLEDNTPFITHMGASHKKDFESEDVQKWVDAISKHLND